MILFGVEIIGSILFATIILGTIVWIAAIVFAIMGLINVSKGEMKSLPLIGKLAEKLNI